VFNPTSDRMYFLGTSSLTVVDASSHSVVASVPFPENNSGGSVNAGLAVDTGTGMVYITVQGELLEVDGSTNMLVRELPLSLGALAFDPATGMLWGTQPFGSRVIEVNPVTGTVLANASVAFSPYEITLDPKAGFVYVGGCNIMGLVCEPGEAIVDAATGAIVATVQLGSPPEMALDPATHVVYVSGAQQLAAFNGMTGEVLFTVDPQTCGPFTDMAVDPAASLVYTSPENSNYLLAYDGATGRLMNMYVFPTPLNQVAFNPSTGQLYVDTAGHLIALRPLSSTGNVDASLIAPPGNFCPLP
jgi:DNA-binding beta-propeller fold protein YncE